MENFFNMNDIQDEYDVVIIGGGPSGCTAGMYAARDNLKTIIFEKNFPGGQVAITDAVENYPGFIEPISGADLSEKFYQHALRYGVQLRSGIVTGVEFSGDYKYITLKDFPKKIKTKTIIISTGSKPKNLGAEGENKFLGRGISFCATCDGGFYRDKVVAVVGGGDSAVEEGAYLTKFASKVYIIHRRDQFRAAKIAQERCFNNPKIEVIWDTAVRSVNGDMKISSITLENLKNNEKYNLEVDGVFVFIGWEAASEAFRGLVNIDSAGFILADETTRTNIPGIFAAGDVRKKELWQIVTAVSDGAVAAKMAERYISETFGH